MGLTKNRRYPKHMIGGWDRRIGQIGLAWVINEKMFRGPKKIACRPCADRVFFCVRVFSKYHSGKYSGKRQNVGHKSYSLFRFAD